MRFLTGVLSGAAMVLVVAATLPGERLASAARESGGALWAGLLQSTQAFLFAPPEPVPAPAEASAEQALDQIREQVLTAVPEAPPINDPQAPAALEPEPQASQAADANSSAEEPKAPGQQQAYLWQPFRSEMSARGFARHLEESLTHPLQVQRDGPGRYRVGFTYETPAQRDQIMDRLAEIMGSSR